MQSIDERHTERFLRWAARGQGIALWEAPVSPEPAFVPFPGHRFVSKTIVDDGRKPTGLSALVRMISNRMAPPQAPVLPPELPEPEPRCISRDALVEIQLFSPKDQRFGREQYQYLFASLSVCREPLAFELVSDGKNITAQIVAHPMDAPLVRGEIESFFPDCVVVTKEGCLRRQWDEADGEFFAAVEFGLEREFMRPLGRPKLDPFVSLVGALTELRPGEFGLIQVIFEPARHEWAENAIRSVSDETGAAFFVNAPELLAGAKEKVACPLYAVVLRLLTRSAESGRVDEIVHNVSGALRVLDGADGNRLVALSNEGYSGEEHLEDLLSRNSRRSGMILNADELTSLVHLPSSDVRSVRLRIHDLTTRHAPSIVTESTGPILGYNVHAGVEVSVALNPEQRMRHMHVVGASGTGKSTLLFNLARYDIEHGNGLAILDPHGDLVDRIAGIVPKERIKDVVLLDPSDAERPVGFNILQAHSELEKTLMASDLVSVFERLSTSWGDQMGSVLSHAVLAFLESEKGGSLADLRRFLVEPAFRESFLATVRDPEIAYYWRKEFPHLSGNKSIGPILTRLETFLTPKLIRNMVTQRENRLDFADILDSGKIFLAKLSQGAIGRENSYLFGTLLVSKFQQLAMARQGISEGKRRDFFLYVDEFHNFITPSMGEILSGARKYRLGLVLAHQELRQLERDREVASAVMGNCYTRVVFRVGDSDARALESGFSHFEAKDIQNLGTGSAICRVERSDFDFNLAVPYPEYPDLEEADARRQEVVDVSRKVYGRSKAEIEAMHPVRYEEAPPPQPRAKVIPSPVVEMSPPAAPKSEPKPVPVPSSSREVMPIPLPPVAEKKPVPSVEIEAPTPGRGGKEHKYLQTFVKQWAMGMGWKATIEAPVTGGAVDVLLSKGETAIACEISVTTSIEHEIGNLRKCAAGGFAHVVSLCPNEEKAREIEAAAKAEIGHALLARMRFFSPPQLFAFVEELDAKTSSKETTVKGYKVKVKYRPVGADEREKKIEDVAAIVAKSLKRAKK